MSKRAIRFIATVGCIAAVSALTACSGTSKSSLRWDPAPNMSTLGQTHDDFRNSFAVTWNEYWRMAGEDMARTFFYDRQSRLSLYPVPR